MVSDLPEPAARYFTYMIRPGTPLLPVAEIDMTGQFSLGTKDDPRYQPMEARQILAAPEGFVWAMRTRGGMPVSGSDSGSWTRFRIVGLIPVGRLGGDRDHTRSAFGRYAAEAVIWAPAALLPGFPYRPIRCSPPLSIVGVSYEKGLLLSQPNRLTLVADFCSYLTDNLRRHLIGTQP
jgi:hypothetical protein